MKKINLMSGLTPLLCAAAFAAAPFSASASTMPAPCIGMDCPDDALSAPAGLQQGLVVNPKQIAGYVDIGQAFKDDDKQPLQRTGAYLTISGVHNERLEVRATIGGLFWYAFPELAQSSRVLRFGPGVGQAQAIYRLGDEPSATGSRIQFGLFPVKYNRDAANLGEYLYRSGTYPAYLWTGGWSYLNSASFLMQGVRVHLSTMNGTLLHDFGMHMERDIAQPLHDFSPSYMITARPNSFLELGAGLVWSNAITFNSSRLAPRDADNAYSKTTNMPVQGLNEFVCSETSAARQFCADQDTIRAAQTWADWEQCQNGDCSNIGFYTFRGVKTMARASVDMGVLLGLPSFSPRRGDFRIYSEIALLGVENQPFFYEERYERMPVMAGLSIPTFGFIDRIAVEGEYRRSRFPNTFAYPFDNLGAIPLPIASGDISYDYEGKERRWQARENWKWSVYATHEITEGVTITAQAASDHLRPPSNVANPPSEPYTQTPSHWYYVLRVNFGI